MGSVDHHNTHTRMKPTIPNQPNLFSLMQPTLLTKNKYSYFICSTCHGRKNNVHGFLIFSFLLLYSTLLDTCGTRGGNAKVPHLLNFMTIRMHNVNHKKAYQKNYKLRHKINTISFNMVLNPKV